MNALSRVLICSFAVFCLIACIAVPGCAGTLTLTSNPSPADYTLTQIYGGQAVYMGTITSAEPAIINVQSGTYHLVMSCKGYMDVERDLKIEGDNSYLTYQGVFTTPAPVENPATLNVYTNLDGTIMSGGIPIYIDDVYAGSTSPSTGLLTVSVSPGQHNIKGIYNAQESVQGITLISGETLPVTLTFQSVSGKIDVTSSPSAASVYLDGQRVGFTPCIVTASPGEHSVEVILAEYTPMSTKITVKDGKTEYLNFPLTKESRSCSMEIRTTPAADVYLDGEYRGTDTLVVTSGVKAGIHKVRIEKEGYEPYFEEITAVADKANQITVTLKKYEEGYVPEPSKPLGRTGLSVDCTNTVASVTLDRKDIGDTPIEYYIERDLKPGEHTLQIEANGYVSITTSIVLVPGEIVPFTYTLHSINGPLVQPEPTVVPVVTEVPTQPTAAPVVVETTAVPTQTPKSPVPFIGLMAGLGVSALVFRRS